MDPPVLTYLLDRLELLDRLVVPKVLLGQQAHRAPQEFKGQLVPRVQQVKPALPDLRVPQVLLV
jgi:hypothetical protein